MLLNILLNFIFPSKCPVCSNKPENHAYNPICTACWRSIKRYTGPACSICGLPAVSSAATICEACIKNKPPFAKAVYYGIYEGVLKESIHLLKFKGIKRLSSPLCRLLSDISVPETDGIIPVPMHPKRLKQRGFNQTAVIGHRLSKKIKAPLMPDVLIKVKDTPPQTDITGKERLKNVRNAFAAEKKINGLNLLLVDDVITTGATVRECSQTLLEAGAKSVVVIAIARSMPKWNT